MALEQSIVVSSFQLVSSAPLTVNLPSGYATMIPLGIHFFSVWGTGSPGPTALELGFDDGTYHGSVAINAGDFLSSFCQSETGASDSNSLSSVRNAALNQYILAGYVSARSAGSFQITFTRWNNIYIGRRVNYLAFGAPLQVKCGRTNTLTGTPGTFRIDPGFKPVIVGLIGSPIVVNATVSGPGAAIGYGWACDCHDQQVAMALASVAGANPSNDNSAFVPGKCMIRTGIGPDAVTHALTVIDWDDTGITVDQPSGGGWQYLHWMAIGGSCAANIVNFQQKTSGAGPQTVPILARNPKAVIILGGGKVASATATPNIRAEIGAGIPNVRQMALWTGERDNQTPQTWGASQTDLDFVGTPASRIITSADPSAYYAGVESAVAMLVSLESQQLNLSWSKTDANALDHMAVVFAERGSVPNPSPCGDDAEDDDTCGCVGPAPDGPVIALAEVDLPDRSTYHHGFKEGLLTAVAETERALSDASGAPETSSSGFSLFDKYGDWRTRLASLDPAIAELKGLYVTMLGISDRERRLEVTPALLFRGAIADYKWATDLQLDVAVENYLSCLLRSLGEREQLPRDTFSELDFPNCRQEHVLPGCRDYVVSGAYLEADNVTEITVTGGTGVFPPGARFQFDSVGTEYSVATGGGTDPETTLKFSPQLDQDLVGDENIDFIEDQYDVEPASGKRIPFGYGYISDRFVEGGIDNGDGQAPFIYVGDRTLPDGQVWGEFVWLGHRCHSPNGRPIDMLYFFNNGLGVSDLEGSPNTWYFEGVAYNPQPLNVEAAVGGRICLPGWPNWVSMGFGTGYNGSFRSYNGHEYTVVYLRSLYRDLALGIMGPPANLGGVPFAGSAYGWGDGNGNLLKKAGHVYKHLWQNYLVGHWRGGPTLSTPLFPDGVPTLDEASFDIADAVADRRVAGGCEFNFICGHADEAISKTDMIRRLNSCFDVQSGENEELQFAIYMEEHDPAVALADAETLDDVNDIFEESGQQFGLEFKVDLVANSVHILHTRDYLGRAESGWRFGGGPGDGLFTNDDSLGLQCEVLGPELELWLIRGRNRATDIPEYQQGTDWVADLAARRLRRTATAPVIATVPTGLRASGGGFRLGSDVLVEHFRNIGGRTARPFRIERVRARVGVSGNGRVIVLEGVDQTRVLET